MRTVRLVLAGALVAAATVFSISPVSQVVEAATVQRFAADLGGPCAVTDQDEVYCWGPAYDGGIGNGTGGTANWGTPSALLPTKASISSVSKMSDGRCALTNAGSVSCWGAAGIIEDGTGSIFSDPPWGATSPTSYGFGTAAKVSGRCALLVAGTVQCQGWDTWGELGRNGLGWPGSGFPTGDNGDPPPPSSATAVNVVGLSGVVDISSGGASVCAVKSNGTVWCWGLNNVGQLGNGQSGNQGYPCPAGTCQAELYESTPVQVSGITDAVSVHQSCAIRSNGQVSCWGTNTGSRYVTGPMGLTATNIPQFNGAVDLDVNSNSACAVFANGSALCRGAGYLGGGFNSNAAGLANLTLQNVREIESISYNSRCARMADGTIACWGSNFSGDLGLGYESNTPVLTPQFVIGFGGEIPDPELAVDVTFAEDEMMLELDGDGEPVPETTTVTVKIKNTSLEAVTNVHLDNVLEKYLYRGPDQGLAQTVFPPIPSVQWASLAAGQTVTVQFTLDVSNYGDFGVGATVRWDIPDSPDRDLSVTRARVSVELDDGFEVDITGESTESPSVVRVTAKIRNVTDDLLDGIVWADDALTLEVLDGTEPLAVLGEPSEPLPDSLEGNETVTIIWLVQVKEAGATLFGLEGVVPNAFGTTSEAFSEMSAQVTAGLIRAIDLQGEAVAGLERFLTENAAKAKQVYADSINEVKNETQIFREAEYESYRNLGFDDSTAQWLASCAVDRQSFNNYISGWSTGAEESIDRLGAQDGESLWRFVDTITDPVKARAVANALVQRGITEYGYLEDGLAQPNTVGMEVAYSVWGDAAVESKNSIGFAITGQMDIWGIEAGEYAENPLAFSTKVGERHGGQGATVGYYTAIGVVEEVATGGLGPVTRVGNIVEGGVDGLRNTARGTEVAGEAIGAGDDALAVAAGQFADGERRIQRFQDLDYGEFVDTDQLEQLGGFSAADAARIDNIIAEAADQYGVEVEMVFRTAEPLSVGIDGVGKRSFTKEKAVGQIDLLLGAPPTLGGKVTIFNPQPLPKAIVESIEWDNPGFTARYQERLTIQQKNWAAFQAGGSRTQKIAQASEQYGGVHVLDGRPGRPTHGVEYLEQLDDPTYMATRPDLTPQQIADVRSHPSATYTNLQIDVVDGAYAVSDNVRVGKDINGDWITEKKPVISDYDGQAVRPVNGEWPPGAKSQVETFIKTEMDKIGRSGRHGWSDAANDLPSDLFDLAAEYTMSTTHPSVARRVAEDLDRRFDLLGDEFTRKADRLEATINDVPAGPLRAQRQAKIDRLRATAATYKAFTADSILAKWPPGEKTIVFTKGRISVGSNQGTGP